MATSISNKYCTAESNQPSMNQIGITSCKISNIKHVGIKNNRLLFRSLTIGNDELMQPTILGYNYFASCDTIIN